MHISVMTIIFYDAVICSLHFKLKIRHPWDTIKTQFLKDLIALEWREFRPPHFWGSVIHRVSSEKTISWSANRHGRLLLLRSLKWTLSCL